MHHGIVGSRISIPWRLASGHAQWIDLVGSLFQTFVCLFENILVLAPVRLFVRVIVQSARGKIRLRILPCRGGLRRLRRCCSYDEPKR
jgi:hypothetical protein